MPSEVAMTLRDRANDLRKTMRCNCDLDNWEPEPDTGHSWVCRIHRKLKGLSEDPVPSNHQRREFWMEGEA